jgi:hypothetical protein
MEAATASKPPKMRMILRRWMLRTRRYVRTLGVFKVVCIFVWIHLTSLNKCFVHFNLRRSCKLGLRRTCCRYEFIGIGCSLVVKRGACSSEHILNKTFPIFGLRPRLNFL